MSVNSKIVRADYNNIRNKLVNIIGPGSADSGWGQSVIATNPVDESNSITVNEWGRLRYDVINAYKHIFGTSPVTAQPEEGDTIKSDFDGAIFNGSISGNTLIVYNQSGANSMLAIGQTLASGGGAGRSIIASINNLPITITSFTSKTVSSGFYLVTYAITSQPVALPFGNNTSVIISGNSNSNYNGTVPITASTTTSITVQYASDPGTYGTGATTITVTPSNPWGYSTWTVSGSGNVAYSAMTATNSTTEHPYLQYDRYANTIIANRFTVHPSQASTFSWPITSTAWPGVYGASWTTKIQTVVTVTFPTSSAARYFFNSGGEIRFSASRSGGSTTQQNTAWTSLLNTVGTQAFGANKPGTGVSPANGQNWYRLTNVYQQWYSLAASTPYGGNSLKISARTPAVSNNSTGSAIVTEFFVEFIDNYVDPGQYPLNPQPDTVDSVDGTFSLAVSHLYATGILEPFGAGNFVVTQPTISVGTIAPPP
jgi:hypothetical protein